MLLHTGQNGKSAARRFAAHALPLAQDQDRDSRAARGGNGIGESRGRRVVDAAAFRVQHVHARSSVTANSRQHGDDVFFLPLGMPWAEPIGLIIR